MSLFTLEVFSCGEWLVFLEKYIALRMRIIAAQLPLQGIHVKPVAGQDVVEGGADAGKETDAMRLKIIFAQLAPGLGQPVIGPGVLIRHGQQMMRKRVIHGHSSWVSCLGETFQLHFLQTTERAAEREFQIAFGVQRLHGHLRFEVQRHFAVVAFVHQGNKPPDAIVVHR
ncbi:hypothetical protein D3C87_1342320 [compost metagenome]